MPKITPFLWYDDKAEEAMNFYRAIFKNSEVPMSVSFWLEGQDFIALNGGPHFTFSPAISLFVSCDTQSEVDDFWEKLSSGGGETSRCGWLKDKYGMSWQIIPKALGMLEDPDPAKSNRVFKAMLQMEKLDIKGLRQAYNQS
jgi:predicted 3-demethylubiquinone-9 3-methyltransferase (glyoxalase superfamily)